MKLYQIKTYLRSPDAPPIYAEQVVNRIRPEPFHTHNCVEIMYIRSGSACCRVNDRLYPVTRGDIYAFAPGDIHAFSISGQLTFDNLLFSLELFTEAEIAQLQEYKIFKHWSTAGDYPEKKLSLAISDVIEIDHAFDELGSEIQAAPLPDTILLKSLLVRLLYTIFRKGSVTGQRIEPSKALQLSRLFDFVANHYSEELTLGKLAAAAKVSPNYLNEFLHRTIGQGAIEYLLRYRVEKVCSDLEYSVKSIAEIAAASGFYDSSHLIRIFRQYTGMTPGQYRKQIMHLQK